jgi:hypothetical protein
MYYYPIHQNLLSYKKSLRNAPSAEACISNFMILRTLFKCGSLHLQLYDIENFIQVLTQNHHHEEQPHVPFLYFPELLQ